jgi:uncharacterized membrane protein
VRSHARPAAGAVPRPKCGAGACSSPRMQLPQWQAARVCACTHRFKHARTYTHARTRTHAHTHSHNGVHTRAHLIPHPPSIPRPAPDVGLDRWLCITLIVATECALKLPKARSLADLKTCLSLLGGLRPDDVIAVELLWTPQEEGDSYSKDEMLQDYPALANL